MEWTAQQSRQAGPLNCLHGTQGWEKSGALHLALCFYFLSAEPLMIPVAKGAFVTTESSLWCCCLRDQQCRAPLTWAFWNPVTLGICFVLVLGKGSELSPNQRQIALVGHGWTKAPLAPAQLQICLFYITEGELWEALLWYGVFDPVFPDTILSSQALLFLERRLWL